ncbi:MAG: sugar ABC transporter substrate-binding protein [Actinomycetia bacterium]|nr:sugar ABC transporter substrate-binding protein [Actinomycetes bacterium]
MKKRLALALALVMVLSVALMGCGKKSSDNAQTDSGSLKGQKITVILPQNEADTVGFRTKMTKQFESETGIKVELIEKGWEAVADDVRGDLSSGGGSYDVIEFDNSWIAEFIKNEWVAPIDEYMSTDMKDGIVPGLLDLFSKDGKHYGIVWNNDTRFYMYNSKMIQDAGLTEAPKTWDEVAALSKKINGPAYMDTYKQEQMGTNEEMFVVYSFGGNFLDKDGNPIVSTDPGVKAAYTWLAQAYKDGVFGKDALTQDYEEVASGFNAGSFPLMLQAVPNVYANSNDKTQSKIVGAVKVADYSVSKTGNEQVVLTLPEAMAITTTSKHKEAAWKYIEYMSSKEMDKQRALQTGALPIWSDLYNDSELLQKFPIYEQFGKQAANSKGYPTILWVADFADIVAKQSQKIMTGSVPVDKGLADMQALMEAAKKKSEQQ